MAIHEDELSMARAALPEYLELARLGIEKGGIGFPTATLLFAVIDAIGSYHRKHPTFTARVDGKEMAIRTTSEHFVILNAPYFGSSNGLALTEEQITRIYKLARCPVTHNASLRAGSALVEGPHEQPPFQEQEKVIGIFLPSLWSVCKNAVDEFLKVADQIIPNSVAAQQLQDRETYVDQVARLVAQWAKEGHAFGITTANVTAMGRVKPRPRFGR